MSKRALKLPLTPLTDTTFIRQGWRKHMVTDSLIMGTDDDTGMDDISEAYYYSIPLPKDRTDEYSPTLVTNATDEIGLLKDMGLRPDTFFVEIAGTEGLGTCTTEEELEILYRVLTGDPLET